MTDIAPSFALIQQESLQTDQPASEAALSALGGLANGIFSLLFPVGTVVDSMLTEMQFHNLTGNPNPSIWVLCNGQDVSGSAYATATGFSSAPDLRGIFRRGKNNGRSDGNQNPDGELPLGTYTADKFLSHTHIYNDVQTFVSVASGTGQSPLFPAAPAQTAATGGNETAPKNLTINSFIRIN